MREFDLGLITDQLIVDSVEQKMQNRRNGYPREEMIVAIERFVGEIMLPSLKIDNTERFSVLSGRPWQRVSTEENETYLDIVKNLAPGEKGWLDRYGEEIGFKIANGLLKSANDFKHSLNNITGTNHEVPGDPNSIKHSMVAGIRGGALSPEDPRINSNVNIHDHGEAYES